MTNGIEKLERDVAIMSAMAGEMGPYLDSDVLFWNMRIPGMPALTLGGYLLRQHRLLLLRDLLDEAQQTEIDAAVVEYNRTIEERIVRLENKGQRECEARIRQWSEYLRDVEQGEAARTSNYATVVEVRAMLAALVAQLSLAPYQLDPNIPKRVGHLDTQLRRHWEKDDFVWPEAWQPAYPQSDYWWLYGRPTTK